MSLQEHASVAPRMSTSPMRRWSLLPVARQRTVLVIDRDEASRRLLGEILGRDYTVLDARDGAEASEILEALPIDIVVTDVTMPRLAGYAYVAKPLALDDLLDKVARAAETR